MEPRNSNPALRLWRAKIVLKVVLLPKPDFGATKCTRLASDTVVDELAHSSATTTDWIVIIDAINEAVTAAPQPLKLGS